MKRPGGLKAKYSIGGRHLIPRRAGRAVGFEDSKRSAELVTIEGVPRTPSSLLWQLLPFLLLLSPSFSSFSSPFSSCSSYSFSFISTSSAFFFFLPMLLHARSTLSLSLTFSSTSFFSSLNELLTYSFSRSTIPAAEAISLSDKSQVVRFRKELKTRLLGSARTLGARLRTAASPT